MVRNVWQVKEAASDYTLAVFVVVYMIIFIAIIFFS